MGLYERLLRLEEPRIAGHGFAAILGEVQRGRLTVAAAATTLGLSGAETTELQTLVNRIPSKTEAVSLGGLAVLTNVGTTFDAVNASRGLGMVLVDTNGLTAIEWHLQVNKIGSGTQNWQLWNDTAGSEIALIQDTGGSGNKTLTTTVTSGLPTGIVRLRVRARSTVSTDDPVYYGSTLLLTLGERLRPDDIHEVLLAADDHRLNVYKTPAALRGRLGV